MPVNRPKGIFRLTGTDQPPPVAPPQGPGTEMKRLLAARGLLPGRNCDCGAYAAWMDRIGVDGCVARRAEIVAHLERQAKARGVACAGVGARYLLARAIRAARRQNPR